MNHNPLRTLGVVAIVLVAAWIVICGGAFALLGLLGLQL